MRDAAADAIDEEHEASPIDPADMPPQLGWESEYWEVYAMCRTQWERSNGVRTRLVYDLPIKIATDRGYDLETFVEMLNAIEATELKHEAEMLQEEWDRASAKSH